MAKPLNEALQTMCHLDDRYRDLGRGDKRLREGQSVA